MKSLIKSVLGKILIWITDSEEYLERRNANKNFISGKKAQTFKSFGQNCYIPYPNMIFNAHYITIGDNFSCFYNLRLEAWDKYLDQTFSPAINIGNNVTLNTDCHFGCIDKIEIGNNVLIASRVYISDHSHGDASVEAIKLSPEHRALVSKGPVIIGDNVWIGEGACILSGVTIGQNSIVGANAVVTHSFPANSVIAGVPAKLIRILD